MHDGSYKYCGLVARLSRIVLSFEDLSGSSWAHIFVSSDFVTCDLVLSLRARPLLLDSPDQLQVPRCGLWLRDGAGPWCVFKDPFAPSFCWLIMLYSYELVLFCWTAHINCGFTVPGSRGQVRSTRGRSWELGTGPTCSPETFVVCIRIPQVSNTSGDLLILFQVQRSMSW